ncbi:DNA adenine methylase [Brevundimonas diminuta]|uniref:DNA adenine methylase n=1 Tax=Brevundimonas diminuta TaxID=293 RepID=UPI0025A65581|nr:DNA adenine methylase [Brevundimonas diminuta]MDM8352794.1 DNA adenine methylase [Brevundimonas diminuta]
MSDRSSSLAVTGRFSPLRYPGGKGKLARFITAVIQENDLSDGLYVEPYAGGAAVAWELLLSGVVRKVAINDLSRPIYCFWKCVLDHTEDLVGMIRETPVDVATRGRQKEIFSNSDTADELELGFATFFLNRTNRSGILNGGMIGGKAQTGQWKLDARYNKDDLIERIERIARARRRVSLTRLDATEFLKTYAGTWNPKTLVYLDPPYFEKGPDLYYNFYKHDDHAGVATAVHSLKDVSWLVSYDDAGPIHDLYDQASWLQYTIGYSARGRVRGREAMFASAGLKLPAVAGSMVELDRWVDGDDAPYRAPALDKVAPEPDLTSPTLETVGDEK